MLQDILLQYRQNYAPVINFEDRKGLHLDFTSNNAAITNEIAKNTTSLSRYINTLLAENNARFGYGGYLEDRVLYKKSDHFGGDSSDSRTIHLGTDIWCPAGEEIFAPLDGSIHSFQNNTNFGDYGPTIILKHRLEGITFHTLYGHLSRSSITSLKAGMPVRKGSKIAELGNEDENGSWPPHLHFQIIHDMENNSGDYPGVCRKDEISKYQKNCPDPKIMLQLDNYEVSR